MVQVSPDSRGTCLREVPTFELSSEGRDRLRQYRVFVRAGGLSLGKRFSGQNRGVNIYYRTQRR